MNRHRRLVPTSTLLGPAVAAAVPKAKRQQVTVACNECRRAKVKCNGKRPSCLRCDRSSTKCTYEADADAHPSIALKRKNEALQKETQELQELLEVLKNSPENEAYNVLLQVRSSAADSSYSSVLALIKETERESSAATSSTDMQMPVLSPSCSFSPVSSSQGSGPYNVPTMTDEMVAPEFVLYPTSLAVSMALDQGVGQLDIPAVIESIKSVQAVIQNGMSDFLVYSGPLFYAYTQGQADECLATVTQWPAQDISMATVCEVCSIAALSAQYVREPLPVEFSSRCYDIAKATLDRCIQADLPKALKVCALLALYNMIKDPAAALGYIDSGLGLARSPSFSSDTPPEFSPLMWTDAKKVWRTLTFCNGWLEPTLGYNSGTEDLSMGIAQFLVADIVSQSFIEDQEFFQLEITKVSILKADFLHTLAHEPLSVKSVKNFKKGLQDWYDALPELTSLSSLASVPLDTPNRRLTFYVHILHLNAIMVLYRRVLSQCLMEPDNLDLIASIDLFPEGFAWLEEGVIAAQQSARIVHLAFSETRRPKQCWLLMFQAYTSCCILLHDAVQKLLWGFPESDWSKNLEDMDMCLEVLAYGAERDPISLKLHRVLKLFSSILYAARVNGDETESMGVAGLRLSDISPQATNSQHLFAPRTGDSLFEHVARRLLTLVCRPYGSADSMAVLNLPMGLL